MLLNYSVKLFFQGPLEKSLQNSMGSERQRNVEHKVSAIKNSAQASYYRLSFVNHVLGMLHRGVVNLNGLAIQIDQD